MTGSPAFDPNAVRTRLKAALEASGKSLRAAAREAGRDHASLSKFLAGKAQALDLATLADFAPVLGTGVGALLGETAADPEPAAQAADSLALLRLDQLVPPADNPRRSFDEDALAELAESIAADGVLQNLVVRTTLDDNAAPSTVGGTGPTGGLQLYQLVAGERRLRALWLLAEAGRWDKAAPSIPCRVIEADRAAARVIAIVENLQRQDVAPLDEARAMHALRTLDPGTWSAPKIAARIGRTERYVQQRLALVEKLEPEIQEALAEGRLDVTRARILTGAPRERQADLLKAIESDSYDVRTEEGLRARAAGKMVPVSKAIFDLAAFEGEIHTDDRGARFVVDPAAFKEAQVAAAKAKAEALGMCYGWAKFTDEWVAWSQYREAEEGDDPAAIGAIVRLGWDHEVEVREGIVDKSGADDEAEKARHSAEQEAWQREQAAKAARRPLLDALEAAVRGRIADDPATAFRLAILAMMDSNRQSPVDIDGFVPAGSHSRAHAPLFGDLTDAPGEDEEGPCPLLWDEAADPAAAWARVMALSDDQARAVFAALVADRFGVHPGHAYRPADLHPVTHALARHYAVAVPPELLPAQADIEDACADSPAEEA